MFSFSLVLIPSSLHCSAVVFFSVHHNLHLFVLLFCSLIAKAFLVLLSQLIFIVMQYITVHMIIPLVSAFLLLLLRVLIYYGAICSLIEISHHINKCSNVHSVSWLT